MTTHTLLLEYISAYNKHDIDKIIDFLDPNCRVIFNDQVWKEGIQALRPTYEQDFLNSDANATIVDIQQDPNDENRIRVLLKTHNKQLVDVTYVFESTTNPNKKMIEHIVHSVQPVSDTSI